jgi:23S rRNA (cytidine1920-2'-O)/16S rRNA (cytidine1409-2'-O)-methyltransferase
MAKKTRLDQYLVEHHLAPSRERARALILSGKVRIGTEPATKAGQTVSGDAQVTVLEKEHPYVGRGGMKLAHAITTFAIDVHDTVCLDAGASTGGFTDCLLQHGAKKIYAIDVGYGQLAWSIRVDERVVVLERTNLRHITRETIPDAINLVTLDLSFISLTKVFPILLPVMQTPGQVVALIKPQFEVGKGKVGKGGIVREPAHRAAAVATVVEAATGLGWIHHGTTESPIHGADGNIEYLAYFEATTK